MRIRDLQTQTWATTHAGAAALDDNALVKLLAALGDHPAADQQALMTALGAPGVTRAQQLDLVKTGLDADELEDVAEILKEQGGRLSPGGRNFLEALLGRAPLQQDAPMLQVSANGAGLNALTLPDATVEVVNMSTAPSALARLEDGVAVGRTDTWGRFQGGVAGAQEGDVLRVRARDATGRTSDWVNVRVTGGQSDMRAAYVALNRLRLEARADGTVALEHHTSKPLTEPDAKVRFQNQSTGAFVDVTVDYKGSIPKDLSLPGKPGDTISVSVTDGAGNTNFAYSAGVLTVPAVRTAGDLEDPAPLNKDRGGSGPTRVVAPLTVNGPTADDVKQGAIGNCYVPASLAAVAHANAADIEEIIKDNGDGTFTVRLYPVDNGLVGDPVFVDVDADLHTDWSGKPRYASTTGWVGGVKELWVSLIEKAYAKWRGSYEVVAQGGSVGMMQSHLLGRHNAEHWTNTNTPAQLWDALTAGVRENRAMSAGTFGTQESARYSGTSVYANHAYSVLGAVEENGQKLVVLRNPWGSGEPAGDGKDDGVFRLPLEKFIQLYQVLNVC